MDNRYPLWTKGDLDGFFGLFIDNLVQLLLIVTLCSGLCGMRGEHAHLLFHYILPGAAISILFGNLFYAWQARRLAHRTGRFDVTALPYGINTPSLLVYVFFVMVPTLEKTGDPRAAWQMGLLACLGSGVIELAGSFVAQWIRDNTPRAALLATLAGIAVGFISMTFALRIWVFPMVAMLPMAFVLAGFFASVRMPGGIPAGLLAIISGTALAWVLPQGITGLDLSLDGIAQSWQQAGWILPGWAGGALWQALEQRPEELLGMLSVIVPMGIFNVIGSLQNVESAEASGDGFATAPSLAANGIGTIVAALLGSCFPTTIYIGHPGWKQMGARAGYSVLNGIVYVVLCLSGTVAVASRVIPLEVGVGILLWIGVIMTAQAFQATPSDHAPAVALALFPAIAAWGATVVSGGFFASGGATMQDVLVSNANAEVNGFSLHGLHILERGYIFTCTIVGAVAVCLIDRKFIAAAMWSLLGAGLSFVGLVHAYQLHGNVIDNLFIFQTGTDNAFEFRANYIGVGYVLMAAVFGLIHLFTRHVRSKET